MGRLLSAFAWGFRILFVAFNLVMLVSLASFIVQSSEAELRDAVALGPLILVWALGALVLGIPASLARTRTSSRPGG